eukprot:1158443-Pelagomonas_calceolata.AAC.22
MAGSLTGLRTLLGSRQGQQQTQWLPHIVRFVKIQAVGQKWFHLTDPRPLSSSVVKRRERGRLGGEGVKEWLGAASYHHSPSLTYRQKRNLWFAISKAGQLAYTAENVPYRVPFFCV